MRPYLTKRTALTRAPTSKNGHTRKQSRHPFLIPPRRDFMTQTHAIIKFLQTQARTLVSALKMLYRNARCSWVAVCLRPWAVSLRLRWQCHRMNNIFNTIVHFEEFKLRQSRVKRSAFATFLSRCQAIQGWLYKADCSLRCGLSSDLATFRVALYFLCELQRSASRSSCG